MDCDHGIDMPPTRPIRADKVGSPQFYSIAARMLYKPASLGVRAPARPDRPGRHPGSANPKKSSAVDDGPRLAKKGQPDVDYR